MGTGKTNRRQKKAQQRVAKSAQQWNKRNLILAVIIGALGFLLYSNTLGHGYVLDDFSVIEKNRIIRQGFSAIPTIFKTSYRAGYEAGHNSLFRPLSLVMFAMEWGISPNNASIHHFINILLYGLGGGVLFLTLIRLFGNRNVMIAFIATLLFIAHPLHTEVVANIKSRDEILLLLFGALALNRFLRYVDSGEMKQLLYSVTWYFLAILSKESAITLLAVFPLCLHFFRDVSLKKVFRSSAIFLGPAVIYLIWRTAILGDVTGHSKVAKIDNLLMFAGNDWLTQKATALMIVGKYLLLLVFPHPLVNDASFNQIPLVGLGDYRAFLSLVVLLALGAFAIWGLKRKHPVAFGITFFFITFSIYSNLIITIGSSYGERFLFLPILGFTIATAFLLGKWLKFDQEEDRSLNLGKLLANHKPVLAIVGVVVVLFGYKTIDRNPDWESELTLYSADVHYSPESARMRYYYGMVLMKDLGVNAATPEEKNAHFDHAISEFKQAVAIYPVYADAWEQMGLAWYRRGNLDSALTSYQKAIELSPCAFRAYSNMGIIYFNQGNLERAKEVYTRAVECNPAFADALMNLGSTYARMGNAQEAIRNYEKALAVKPDLAMVHANLAQTYQLLGNTEKANYHQTLFTKYQNQK